MNITMPIFVLLVVALSVAMNSSPINASNILYNSNYQTSGSGVAWAPIRVYDDGVNTFIEFDSKLIGDSDLPVLVRSDTLFAINYIIEASEYNKNGDIIKNAFIVTNGVFETFRLVRNLGSSVGISVKRMDDPNDRS